METENFVFLGLEENNHNAVICTGCDQSFSIDPLDGIIQDWIESKLIISSKIGANQVWSQQINCYVPKCPHCGIQD